jgi:hypothetical protein
MAASDARPVPIKGVAYRVTFPIFDADGDLVTGAAGLDSEISKDAGTFADCTNESTEIAAASGIYYLDLTATEMNADCVAIIVKTSTSGAKTTPLVIYPASATRGLAGTALPAAAADAAGGLPISDAGGLDLDAKLAATNEITAARMGALTDWINGGRLDLILDAAAKESGGNLATILGRIVGTLAAGTHNPQSGDAYARLGAAGAGLTALGDTRLANLNAPIDSRLATAGYATPPTAGAIADQVWDEAIADHLGAGSTGLALSTASSGGVDPAVLADAVCDEALAGHTTAGTLGKKIADLANADLSGVATGTALSTLAGVVVAVKAKTDKLTDDPADESALEALISALDTAVNAIGIIVTNLHDTDLPAVKADTAETLTRLPDAVPGASGGVALVGSIMALTAAYDAAKTAAAPGAAMALTAAERTAAGARTVGPATLDGILLVILAAVLAKTSGAGAEASEIVVRNIADLADLATVTVDENGNRLTVAVTWENA